MRLFYYFLLLFLVSTSFSHSKDKAYFAGGCFWCMEESFEMLEGVEEVISGYSGGITANPTYREVTYGDTGHFEVVEIIYDKEKISYKELLKNFWLNIDPFDAYGQFCDKGYSYRSVAFYENDYQKDLIDKDIKKNELYVSQDQSPLVYSGQVELSDLNLINKKIGKNDIKVRFRHGGKLRDCDFNIVDNKYILTLKESERGIAPGQAAVLYQDTHCLGGGVIKSKCLNKN